MRKIMNSLKHFTVNRLGRRGAKNHLHGVTLRCGGDCRQKRRLCVFGELLRLVENQHVNREPAARILRPGNELDRAAVVQDDGLLSATVRDPLNPRLHVVCFEKRHHTVECLNCRLYLMRGMKNFHPQEGGAINLKDFNKGVLSVLTRHSNTPTASGPTLVVALTHGPHPRPEYRLLPRVRREAEHSGNLNRFLGAASVAIRPPGECRFLRAFKHQAPLVFFLRICSISSSRAVTLFVTLDPPLISSSSREISAARKAKDATSRPESVRERVTRILSRRSSRTFSCGFINAS